MRITAPVAGLFTFAVIILSHGAIAHAQTQPQIALATETKTSNTGYEQKILAAAEQASTPKEAQPAAQEHVVSEGENLSKIATQYQTTWPRLFAKNTQIADPNLIDVGQKLVIPTTDEQLADRPLPVPEPASAPAPAPKPTHNETTAQPRSVNTVRGTSTGNTYTAGYCTYYAKQRRPDLPNNLGNAATWVVRAAAQGIPTGSAPRAGAVGQAGNHVVYVEQVNGDGTVTISEMNHVGLWVVSARTVPASMFQYIY